MNDDTEITLDLFSLRERILTLLNLEFTYFTKISGETVESVKFFRFS